MTQEELEALWGQAAPVKAAMEPIPSAQTESMSQEDLAAMWDQLDPVGAPAQAPEAQAQAPAQVTEAQIAEEELDVPPIDPAEFSDWQSRGAPEQEERSLADKAIGVGETILSGITGSTIGTAGMVAGFAKGVKKAVESGLFGTPEGADMIQAEAMRGMEQTTYAPRTEAGQEISQELGELTAPLQALGPMVPQVPPAARELALQKLGGARFKARATPDTEAPEAAEVKTADLASSVKKAAAGGVGSGRAKKILADMGAPDPEVEAAAQRLGISDYLQADHKTSNQQFREISQIAKSIPGSDLRAEEIGGLASIARRADNLIDEIGGSDDWSTMASDVKTRMQGIQDELSSRANKLYGTIEETIPAGTKVRADNVVSWIQKRAEDLQGAKNLSPAEKKVLKRLSPKDDGRLPSYALLDSTRKELVAARLRKEGAFKDADSGLIKKIESEMRKDQRAVAEKFEVDGEFDMAQQAVAQRKSLEADMTSLFGRQLDGTFVTPLRAGIAGLAKGDVAKLKKTIDAIPEEMRAGVVATGLETAFGKSAKRGEISFSNFADWHKNAVKNKAAYNEVMKYLPAESRKRLSDLATVSDGIRKATREYSVTGRGEQLRQSLEAVDGFVKNVISNGVTGIVGAAADMVAPGAGVALAIKNGLTKGKTNQSRAVDRLLSSKEFNGLIQERVRDGAASQITVDKLAKSMPFKNYERASGGLGLAADAWILDAMRPSADSGPFQMDEPMVMNGAAPSTGFNGAPVTRVSGQRRALQDGMTLGERLEEQSRILGTGGLIGG